jgi:excinuclease ABC subunit C
MRIPEPTRLHSGAEDLEERIAGLRKIAGVYALTLGGVPVHLSWSTNLERRLRRLLLSYPGSGEARHSMADKIDSIECWPIGSRLEQHLLLHRLAKKFYPDRYVSFLKLRMPWFVGITQDPFPRSEVTNRLSARFGMVWGPFAGRGIAQEYEQEVLGLFQMRRCPELLVPTQEHPGCIYGEMNQCLRPCQCIVSQDEYAAEVNRVTEFLANNGRSALASLSAARQRASENMQFEEAALIHRRIDRIKAAAARRPAVIEEVHSFNGVALTRAVDSSHCRLWLMWQACWQEPVDLHLSTLGGHSRSLDTELRELLAQHLKEPHTGEHPVEELAIFSRWYYSSWCDGEWFPFRDFTSLNYRKLVREISRMAQANSPTVT